MEPYSDNAYDRSSPRVWMMGTDAPGGCHHASITVVTARSLRSPRTSVVHPPKKTHEARFPAAGDDENSVDLRDTRVIGSR